MRKKTLVKEIERLNVALTEAENTIEHLHGAIDSYRADLSTLETMYAIAKDELVTAETDLSYVKQQREELFTRCTDLNNELNYVKRVMRAIKVLNHNNISFHVSYEGLNTILEIYTTDTDGNETVIRLKYGAWCVESEDGLNGMLISDRWGVSSDCIELYSDNEVEYYLSLTRNVLEKC